MLTGRYPISLGWQKNEASAFETGGLGLEETTIADVLRTNGYSTYMFGKWNQGNSSPRYERVDVRRTERPLMTPDIISVAPPPCPRFVSYLPTARGFDSFVGFLNGDNYYFSKVPPKTSLAAQPAVGQH
jgi:arylsulfatase A-like enzyme